MWLSITLIILFVAQSVPNSAVWVLSNLCPYYSDNTVGVFVFHLDFHLNTVSQTGFILFLAQPWLSIC